MKKLLCSLIAFALISSIHAQDFYSASLTSIDGKNIDLNTYKGKKVLIIVLPLNESDVTVINDLAAFKSRYQSKINIIGIPAIDEGYKNGDEKKLNKIYKLDKNIDMVISGGIYVKKISSTAQSDLFKWLTNKKGNGHFDQDVKGIGHKFFVNETGELYAVLSPEALLSARMVEKIVNHP